MQGEFDQEGMEPEHGEVVTLGFGKLLGLLFILALVCGLCFGLGYFVGHRGVKPMTTAASTTGAEQQPLQASGAIPKTAASVPDALAVPPITPDASQQNTSTGSPSAGKVSAQPAPLRAKQPQAASPPPPRAVSQQQPQPDAGAHIAPAPAGSFMVQIAAVANPKDAEVLISALRKLKYSITAQYEAADNLIHIRTGPFATRAEADEWCTLLANDGYNAVVQQ